MLCHVVDEGIIFFTTKTVSALLDSRSPTLHSVEVMVYQYDKLFGYGCWMTSIPTITHIFIFLGYLEFSS